MRYLGILSLYFFFGISSTFAQYTETINSNRPGASQGAFSVGAGMLQLETGVFMGNDNHNLLLSDTDILGADYALRYGLIFEELELLVNGSFQDETTTIRVGPDDVEFNTSNFRSNTIGLKLLVFDPQRNIEEDKPNLYSWKANQGFKWKTLIPAVSVYAGANFSWWENPYMFPGESAFSPKVALITQNNFPGGFVFVTNLILDKFSEEFPTYAGIFTLTHAFSPKFAGFLEYQGLISDIYADDLFRTGAAYLLTENLQLDVSGLINFKNTPARWQIAAGFSYRINLHHEDIFLEESLEGDKRRGRSKRRGLEVEPETEEGGN